MFCIAYLIITCTALSVSAISTNGRVKGGGVYCKYNVFNLILKDMISRAIGPEMGGSIGVIFYAGNIVSGGIYIIGLE